MSTFIYSPAMATQNSEISAALWAMLTRGDGGGTVWSKIGDHPTREELAHDKGRGYVVGGLVKPLIMDNVSMALHPAGMGQIDRWMTANAEDILAADGVGFWIDSDGKVWFDVCEVFSSKRMAMHAGRVAGELEIFDLVSGNCFPVTPL